MALGLSMSNHQTLQALTINAAKTRFKDKDVGSVEVGKLADLTIVDGNPLDNLKYAAAVRYVVKNGVVYSLDQIIAPSKSPAQRGARPSSHSTRPARRTRATAKSRSAALDSETSCG